MKYFLRNKLHHTILRIPKQAKGILKNAIFVSVVPDDESLIGNKNVAPLEMRTTNHWKILYNAESYEPSESDRCMVKNRVK